MSAKLLYNLSEENPNLNKQFGCMNGIFQVFYRQHYPARQGIVDKSLPPPGGERRDLVSETTMESDKETMERSTKKKKKKKEKHRVSSESSSRPSFSSSPRSSSFSSAEVSSTTASQLEQPGENLIREQQSNGGGFKAPYDLKELVKGSINRDMRTRGEGEAAAFKLKESHRLSYDEREMRNKTGSKFKETPRLSLDSRSNSFRSSQRPDVAMRSSCSPEGHRRSNSSVVAKLMGLEVVADNFDSEQRKKNLFCDSPRPMSRVEPTALQRSRGVDSIKKIMPASKFPMEPAPWKQTKAGDNAVTVYGEIQKRLTQLEFKKSGKDLRALKQILDAMEKTQQLIDVSRDDRTMCTTTLMQRTYPQVLAATSLAMKPEAPVSISSRPRNVALSNVKVGNPKQTRKVASGKQDAMDLTPRPGGLYKGQLDSVKSSPKTKSQQQSVSPRTQTKKLGFERQPRPTTPKSEPGKIQRQQGESASPRRKQAMKPRSTLKQPYDRLSDTSSDLRSLRSESNISLGSNVDILELQTPKQRSPDFGIKQDRPSLRPLKVTIEQPSPVSVLDAAFDEEDSPSPVRKISLSFKEDDAIRSEESVWINKPTSVCRPILFPEEDADLKTGGHKYISEILLASGLLRDLEYSMISIQLNQARLPINPGLFNILEQNKACNMTLPANKHRGFRQQQANSTEKIRRKLVFDTVNEILAQRFTAEGCTKPWLTANRLTTIEKRSKAEQLLQTLCSDIDRLQENNSRCILEDSEEDIIWEDLQSQDMNLKGFEGETPGIVLDIERMIFRDLVSEVCFC